MEIAGAVQFVQRVLVMFMPAKYQPDYMFLRNVPMRRVHLFTIIQFACIVVLCVIKELGIVSIIFPVMVSSLIFHLFRASFANEGQFASQLNLGYF